MRHSKLWAVAVAVALAATLPVSPLAGGGGTHPAGAAAPPLEQIRESVDYLVGAYGVSTDEAVRRVVLDADSADLGRRVARAIPEQYAGMWLDQRAGRLAIAATDPDRAREVVRGLPHREEIQVVPAARSLRDLGHLRDTLRALIGDAGYADVDSRHNQVGVWTDRPAAVRTLLAGRTLDPRGYAIRPVPRGQHTACHKLAPTATPTCDPPFRGGLQIQMQNGAGAEVATCTSGFNVIDNSGRFYTTTAGHCFTDLPDIQFSTAATLPNGDSRRVGNGRHRRAVIVNQAGPLLDYAITPVVNPDFWVPGDRGRPFVYFHCGFPSVAQCFNVLNKHRYRVWDVRDYGGMAVGNLVCVTGQSPRTTVVQGTRCGEVTSLANGGITYNVCTKIGDSGAPVFNQVTHEAFGTQSQVVPPNTNDGACRPDAREWASLATPVSTMLANAQVRTGRTYQVITGM